jgi:hypothetical protein
MQTLDDVFLAITSAAELRDSDTLSVAAHDLETLLMYGDDGVMSEATQKLVTVLHSDDFRAAPGVWRVLFAIRDDIHRLSSAEKASLVAAMVSAYPYFGDWMSRFTISELMEHFADATTLQLIVNELANADEDSRKFLPHALEHICYGADSDAVRTAAVGRIGDRLKDSSNHVRDEARASLERIVRRGGDGAAAASAILNR